MLNVTFPIKNEELLPVSTAKLIEQKFKETRTDDERVKVLYDYCDAVHDAVFELVNTTKIRYKNVNGADLVYYLFASISAIASGIIYDNISSALGAVWSIVFALLTVGLIILGVAESVRQKECKRHLDTLTKIYHSIPYKY